MNNTAFFNQVMERLGRRTSTELRASAVLEANEIIKTLQRDLPWAPWFLFQRAEVVVPAESETLDVGARFVHLEEDYPVFFWAADADYAASPKVWTALERSDPAEVFKDNVQEDAPRFWSLEPGYATTVIRFSPVPSWAGRLSYQGYVSAGDITDDSATHVWVAEAYQWLVNETVATLALGYLHNATLAQAARVEAEQYKRAHYVKSVAFQNMQYSLAKGE